MQAAAKAKAKRQTCSNNKNKAHRAEELGGEREEDCKEKKHDVDDEVEDKQARRQFKHTHKRTN